MKRMLSALVVVLAASLAPSSGAQAEDGFRSLFNGKDLTGWDGNPELWSVEDGCITGKTTGPEQLSYNQFLIWRGGVLKDFEIRVTAKVTGNNTGIQYRSKELSDVGRWSIGGYQCDVHPAAPNNAMLYDERGRGIVAQNGQSVVVDPKGDRYLTASREPVAVDTAEWNEYTVIARGNKLIHKLNGKVTAEIVDYEDANLELEGLLALQIHRGPAMQVQFKEILLKDLPTEAPVKFTADAVPADAKPIAKPAPGGKKPAAKAKPGAQAKPAGKAKPAAKPASPDKK